MTKSPRLFLLVLLFAAAPACGQGPLQVTWVRAGNGTGSVASNQPGLNCELSPCSAYLLPQSPGDAGRDAHRDLGVPGLDRLRLRLGHDL
jgi:hypothetical protein